MAAHDDVIKWKHFPRYWPFVRGIHRSPVDSKHPQSPVTQSFGVFIDLPEETVEQTIETPWICDSIALIMTSL